MNDFTYMRKPVAVEAFQVPSLDDSGKMTAWPSWLFSDIAKGVLKPLERGGILVMAGEDEGARGDFTVPVGDWIVRNDNGLYEQYDTTEFVSTFEKAPGVALAGGR